MNKTLSSSSYLYLILLLIGLQTSKTNGDESTEQVTITDDTTEAFTEQQVKSFTTMRITEIIRIKFYTFLKKDSFLRVAG